jgi:hypothetical protein
MPPPTRGPALTPNSLSPSQLTPSGLPDLRLDASVRAVLPEPFTLPALMENSTFENLFQNPIVLRCVMRSEAKKLLISGK